MHPLLQRQLEKTGIQGADSITPELWAAFLERVERSYLQADQDRYILERSLTLSSEEMQTELNERHKAEAALQEAYAKLEQQTRRTQRVNALVRALAEQMETSVKRGAPNEELLHYLYLLQQEFEILG
ncbi:MAG: hypothetical protein K8I60_04875 [Anaerolineae bacterium]|nr:hypothetical protein [Anaerolineae bacterium]